jgi:poly-gamma-glutamate synthesis protein (capsule biosynthesis protein)
MDPRGQGTRAERQAARRRARRHPVRRILIALLVVAMLAAAAVGGWAVFGPDDDNGGGGGAQVETEPTDPTATSADPDSTTTTSAPRDPRRGSGEAVKFAFGGDVHFEGALRAQLDADPASVLAPIAPVLSQADVAVVNLETAITERGTPEEKAFVFRAPASALTALAAAGVDAASMANNHGRDYGAVGFEDSLAAKASTTTPTVIGIGANATEAYAPYRVEVKGQRIAVITATQVLDNHLISTWTATDSQGGLASAKEVDRLVSAVTEARADTDTLVVYVHWGVEGQTCPSSNQQTLAQQLVDAGADIVVGSHAHRVQGGGRLGAALVDYGLGNFVWYNESGESGTTGVLQVTATGRDIDAYSWVPAVISGGRPTPLTGAPADAAVAAWDGLRACAGLAP